MRSLAPKAFFVLTGAAALAGCLVSETPVLDSKSGKATPIDPGDYLMCPLGEDAEDGCETFSVEHDATGLYRFLKQDEDPAEMRFRRIGRGGYAVQSDEGDAYMYYYGAGDSQRFRLVMMMCQELPEGTRARLIELGDLQSDDDDFETCAVNTVKGLTEAARAYHRGKAVSDDEIALEFTPVE